MVQAIDGPALCGGLSGTPYVDAVECFFCEEGLAPYNTPSTVIPDKLGSWALFTSCDERDD